MSSFGNTSQFSSSDGSNDTNNDSCSSTTWVTILKVVVTIIVFIMIILLIMMIFRAINRPQRYLRDQRYDYNLGQQAVTIDTRQYAPPPQNPSYNNTPQNLPSPPPMVNVATVQAAISPPTMTGPSIYPLVYSRGY